MKYDVITVGAAVRDVYVQSADFRVSRSRTKTTEEACFMLGEKIEVDAPLFSSGGGATNAAATFAHLGLKAACIAKIGNDDTGESLLRDLQHHGIHTNLMVKDERHMTGYSTLLTASNGQRTAIVHRGASAHLKPSEITWRRVRTKWIYITSLGGNLSLLRTILQHAAKHNIFVAWNPGSLELQADQKDLRKLITRVDVLSLNREEAARLTGKDAQNIYGILHELSQFPRLTSVLTDGKRGTYGCRGTTCFRALPNDVPIINTTGAGDAFGSGFVAGLMHYNNDLTSALRLGTLNAESVIQKIGSKNGILLRMPGTRRLGTVAVEPICIT